MVSKTMNIFTQRPGDHGIFFFNRKRTGQSIGSRRRHCGVLRHPGEGNYLYFLYLIFVARVASRDGGWTARVFRLEMIPISVFEFGYDTIWREGLEKVI